MPTVPFDPVSAVVRHCLDAEAHQLPLFGQDEDPWHGLMAASLSIDGHTLRQFIEAMVRLGEPVDPARMFMDASYAYRHLATAHASSDEGLKALSLLIFERYQLLQLRRQGRVAQQPLAH